MCVSLSQRLKPQLYTHTHMQQPPQTKPDTTSDQNHWESKKVRLAASLADGVCAPPEGQLQLLQLLLAPHAKRCCGLVKRGQQLQPVLPEASTMPLQVQQPGTHACATADCCHRTQTNGSNTKQKDLKLLLVFSCVLRCEKALNACLYVCSSVNIRAKR